MTLTDQKLEVKRLERKLNKRQQRLDVAQQDVKRRQQRVDRTNKKLEQVRNGKPAKNGKAA